MTLTGYSRMKLEQGEARIDPLLEGVAWIRKRIGDRTYEAMVEAEDTNGGHQLQCLPHRNFPEAETEQTVRVQINDWTNWMVPLRDFQQLEWLQEIPPMPMSREELLGRIRTTQVVPEEPGQELEWIPPLNPHPEWGSETE